MHQQKRRTISKMSIYFHVLLSNEWQMKSTASKVHTYASKTCMRIQNPDGLPRVNVPEGKSWNAVETITFQLPAGKTNGTPLQPPPSPQTDSISLANPSAPFLTIMTVAVVVILQVVVVMAEIWHLRPENDRPPRLFPYLGYFLNFCNTTSVLQNWSAMFCQKLKKTTRHTGHPTSITSIRVT